MYNVGDTIIYGNQGVCTVSEIQQKDFMGSLSDYYVLRPVFDTKTTVFVPMHSSKLTSKMSRVLSEFEMREFIDSIPMYEPDWVENENERKEKYKAMLLNVNRTKIVKTIRALYTHEKSQKDKGKNLHATDESFLRTAEKMIWDEAATVLKISREDAAALVSKKLNPEL